MISNNVKLFQTLSASAITWRELPTEMQNEYEKQLEQVKNTVHKLRSQQKKDHIDEGNHLEDAKVITSISS